MAEVRQLSILCFEVQQKRPLRITRTMKAGRKDYFYSTTRAKVLRAYGKVARATKLPVSGDLENGYGENPEDVAETIRGSIAARMVGGSIEDQGVVPSDE